MVQTSMSTLIKIYFIELFMRMKWDFFYRQKRGHLTFPELNCILLYNSKYKNASHIGIKIPEEKNLISVAFYNKKVTFHGIEYRHNTDTEDEVILKYLEGIRWTLSMHPNDIAGLAQRGEVQDPFRTELYYAQNSVAYNRWFFEHMERCFHLIMPTMGLSTTRKMTINSRYTGIVTKYNLGSLTFQIMEFSRLLWSVTLRYEDDTVRFQNQMFGGSGYSNIHIIQVRNVFIQKLLEEEEGKRCGG